MIHDVFSLQLVFGNFSGKLLDYFAQIPLDTHQMGSTGARFYVPPNSNPLNEVVDPLVWTEQRHYGSQMLIRMESSGIFGVESAATYPAFHARIQSGLSMVWNMWDDH